MGVSSSLIKTNRFSKTGAPPQKTTPCWRHMNLHRMVGKRAKPGPMAVLEHAADPGLISLFTKQA